MRRHGLHLFIYPSIAASMPPARCACSQHHYRLIRCSSPSLFGLTIQIGTGARTGSSRRRNIKPVWMNRRCNACTSAQYTHTSVAAYKILCLRHTDTKPERGEMRLQEKSGNEKDAEFIFRSNPMRITPLFTISTGPIPVVIILG